MQNGEEYRKLSIDLEKKFEINGKSNELRKIDSITSVIIILTYLCYIN